MALHRCNYLRETDAFVIKRCFSNKQLVEYTKTKKQHIIPCHSEFKKNHGKDAGQNRQPLLFRKSSWKAGGEPLISPFHLSYSF